MSESYIESTSQVDHLNSFAYSSTPERHSNLSGLTLDSGLDTTGSPNCKTGSPNFKSGSLSFKSGSPFKNDSFKVTPFNSPRKGMNSTPIRFQDGGVESKTNLIVNYLPQTMTTDNFRELFRSMGEIENCKLCRNKETKLSLGYGFVNYRNPQDAMKAVNQLNGRPIQNKQIKVSFARPSSHHIKNTNLYVAGLPKIYTDVEVRGLFSRAGKIISSRILHCKETGLSRGVGFVRFDTRSEAEMAVKEFNQFIIPGHGETITVKFANPSERANCEQLKGKNENEVSNFEEKKNTKSLQAVFEQMVLANYQKSISTNQNSRQFGRSISTDLNNVQRGTFPRGHQNCPVLISVSNLGPKVTEKEIWEVFGPFGAVTNVTITEKSPETSDKEGLIATVVMPIYNEALCAITSINDSEIGGFKVNVAFKNSFDLQRSMMQ